MIESINEDTRKSPEEAFSNGDFYRIGRLLTSSLSLTTRLDRVIEQAMELLQADRGSIMLLDEEAQELVVKASRGLSSSREFRVSVGQGIAGWVAKHGDPLVLQDVVSDRRFTGTDDSVKSALAVPLRVEGKVIGVLNISNAVRKRRFDNQDLEHLSAFADMAAVAIENARLYEALRRDQEQVNKELRMASRIQRSIISTHVPCASVRMVSRLMPASAVGGDFFSIIPLDRDTQFCFYCSSEVQDRCQKLRTEFCPNKFGLMIGDVANKGMPAALIMSVLTTILYEVGRHHISPRAILNEANAAFRRFFNESQYGFATLFYAFYDNTDNTLTYTKAGHEPPLLLRGRSGDYEYLEGEGFPVGLMEDGAYQEKTVRLEREDRILLYTDGLTGALNSKGEILGRKRLVEVVKSHAGEDIEAFLDALADEIMLFSGDAPQPDDIAVMVMELEDLYDLTMTVGTDVLQIRYVINSVLETLQGFEGLKDPITLRLCLEELLHNAMEHGNRCDVSKKVYITVKAEPTRATIRVRDEGEGFDLKRVTDANAGEPDVLSERGRGILIVRHYADELRFNREGNEATLVFTADR
ncbi:MAG: SpoIIE family protein phosphatase [Actinobacteria bacterium]|nr:SpoIIE family protein phosphatase [Actinomycetota bacterium]